MTDARITKMRKWLNGQLDEWGEKVSKAVGTRMDWGMLDMMLNQLADLGRTEGLNPHCGRLLARFGFSVEWRSPTNEHCGFEARV